MRFLERFIKKIFALHINKFSILLFSSFIIVVVFVIMLIILGIVQDMSGTYARFYSVETADKLNSYLNREIALVERVARSHSVIDWFSDEDNVEKRQAAYDEMMTYANMYQAANLYFGINSSLNEFSINSGESFQEFAPFAVLNSIYEYDAWYFNCINADTPYQLNLDVDKVSRTRRVWFNHKVMNNGIPVGVFCTGLQFDEVFEELFGQYEHNNVIGLLIDAEGIIMMNSSRNTAMYYDDYKDFSKYDLPRITEFITDPIFINAITKRLADAKRNYGETGEPEIFRVKQAGYEIASITPIAGTDWTAVTFFNSRSLFDITRFMPLIIVLLIVFLVYFFIINRMFRRINLQSEAIQESLVIAQTASKAKGNFLSNMSHEIRTPLNAIIGMTAIGQKSPEPERKDYAFEKIDDASKHLLGVINDILDMSKIEAGKFELSQTEFNLNTLIKQVVNVINFRMEEKKQKLSIHVDTDIPEKLIGDDQRLKQVIANLLSNAVKFTPEGKNIQLHASLKNQHDNIYTVLISVEDKGIGIKPEQLSRLFTSFEQAENDTSRKYGGTGLGLAISKHIVETMGGEIWAESELGKGSIFSFIIPFEAAQDSISAADHSNAEEEIPIFEGRRILLAEDIDINREIVAMMLEPTKMTIDFACNGEEALLKFSEAPNVYDLIFMDIQMPEMDGFAATRAIRSLDVPHAASVPIVAMTANVFKEDINKCIEAGMNDHVGKPLDFKEVFAKLKKYLG